MSSTYYYYYYYYYYYSPTCFGHRSDRNTLAKNNNNNNTRPNIFVNVRVLICYVSIKHSLMHGHGPHNVFLNILKNNDTVP